MSGWLTRATSLFQQAPPPPEPFEVECDCGGKVVGLRTTVHQKPICSGCKLTVFVLPANVYPVLINKSKPKKASVPPSLDSKSSRNASNDIVDDAPTDTLPKSKPASKLTSKSASGEKPSEKREAPPADDQTILQEPPTRFVTPLRLITFAILITSGLTIAALWHRQRVETAKSIVAKATDDGLAALKERNFPKAAVELERANWAVNILGRTDKTANDIRRFSQEASAITKLLQGSLTDVVEETLSTEKPDQKEPSKLPSYHRDGWVIFDANMIQSGKDKDRFVVDGPILLEERRVRIEIKSPLIRMAANVSEPAENPRVIFAAQVDELTSFKGEPPTAALRLNSRTLFLWTNYDTYSAIGYRPFDSESERLTRLTLERQLELQQK